MKSTKDEMLPGPNMVKVSDPIVTGVDPVPDDSISQKSSKETHSGGGLSGEASISTEPFMLRQRTDEAIPCQRTISAEEAAKKLTVKVALAEKPLPTQNHSCCASAQMKR